MNEIELILHHLLTSTKIAKGIKDGNKDSIAQGKFVGDVYNRFENPLKDMSKENLELMVSVLLSGISDVSSMLFQVIEEFNEEMDEDIFE